MASHEVPFLGDFVINPDGSTLSARDIDTNTISPFSGNIINVPYPYTLLVSNLSAVSATINQVNILVTELSGFIVEGSDNSIHIHSIIIPGSNDLSINHAPISSNSWVSIAGDLQTQNDLYVSGVAYIADEFVTNFTAVNLSALNANTYNLTGVNNWFTNETVVDSHITNLTATNLSGLNVQTYNLTGVNNYFTNVTISNCLSTDCISPFTADASISAHGNIDMLGYSISGIGNNSLSFQSGLKISSDSEKRLRMDTYSTSENMTCSAFGLHAHAEGTGTVASGDYSHAEGANNTASGFYTHAEGANNTAIADWSHVEGLNNIAYSGHAEGENNISKQGSHVEGLFSTADGYHSHAEGRSRSSGIHAHSEGIYTHAAGNHSHSAGQYSVAAHDQTFVWSSYNTSVSSTNTNQFTVSAGNGVRLGQNVEIGGNISFVGATTFSGTVTALGTFLTITLNGSAVAIPLYSY